MSDTHLTSARILAATVLLLTGSLLADAQTPTFNADVAPILHRYCVSCHQPDGSAPFPLISYRDARIRASQIADATARRIMPPWQAEPGEHTFIGQERPTDSELDLITRWASNGAPQGNTPPPAAPRLSRGWQLGRARSRHHDARGVPAACRRT